MGMKANSGLFIGTNGYSSQKILQLLTNENTASVWGHIVATSENYPGTMIPRSFVIDTFAGKMWTHGNATEHMYEALSSNKAFPKLKNSNPKLYAQFILYDYYKNLNNVVKYGIQYQKILKSGSWEFILSKPRKQEYYPVVKHARFTGLS